MELRRPSGPSLSRQRFLHSSHAERQLCSDIHGVSPQQLGLHHPGNAKTVHDFEFTIRLFDPSPTTTLLLILTRPTQNCWVVYTSFPVPPIDSDPSLDDRCTATISSGPYMPQPLHPTPHHLLRAHIQTSPPSAPNRTLAASISPHPPPQGVARRGADAAPRLPAGANQDTELSKLWNRLQFALYRTHFGNSPAAGGEAEATPRRLPPSRLRAAPLARAPS